MNILRDKAVVLPVGGQDVTKALELYLKHLRAKQVYSIHDFDQLVVEQIKVIILANYPPLDLEYFFFV